VSLRRRKDGQGAEAVQHGWVLDAEHEWVAEGPEVHIAQIANALNASAQSISDRVLILSFGTAVGRYDAGPLGILHVRSGKWTEDHYSSMLEDIAGWASALPFHAGAPSSVPYSRTELRAPDVLYHVFMWLRRAVIEDKEARLVGALRAILRDPHRQIRAEDRLAPAEFATRLSPRALERVAAGAHPLHRVRKGAGLAGGTLFPIEVLERISTPTSDTAENRFVKAFLDAGGHVVEAMRQRIQKASTSLARRVRADCAAIEGELEPIRRHRLWEGVGAMVLFPAASTVLQRRAPYREVLRHHILMRQASKALPLAHAEVAEMLEVKNITTLYELWTAFAVFDAVTSVKGRPASAQRVAVNGLAASVRGGLLARWSDGTEIAYNASFSKASGFHGRSWSVRLRPDVSLWVPTGPSAGLHLLDAKFKLDGSLKRDAAKVRPDDLHKMHTYRDAITEAKSAWVMYPGTATVERRPINANSVEGVGAVPLVPGVHPKELHALVARMLGLPSTRSDTFNSRQSDLHALV